MTLFLDVQPQHSLHEVGGLANCQEMGISVCVVYSDIFDECSIFIPDDSHLEQFQNTMPDVYLHDHFSSDMDELRNALEKDSVVGFDIKSFEYNLLKPCIDEIAHIHPSTIDMVEYICKASGSDVSAEDVIPHTLGVKKTQKDRHISHDCKSDDLEEIINCCKSNVQLTHGVYTYGVENGFVKYFDARSNKVLNLEVDW